MTGSRLESALRALVLVTALLALSAPAWAATPPAPGPTPLSEDAVEIIKDEGFEARLVNGQQILLAVRPEKGDGYISMARRLCRNEKSWPALQAANGGQEVVLGRSVIVPWDLMREEFQYLALLSLFPEDEPSDKGWRHFPHKTRVETFGEGFWQVALWFTGKGENWERIALSNSVAGPEVPKGKAITIPNELLLPIFHQVTTSDDGGLRYGEDDKGPYAEYRLQKKEALYSAVVLRFTDVLEPIEVTETAEQIAKRNGIKDVRKIPIGKRIKIPLELLSLAALPTNHPRRIVARVTESELANVALPSRAKALRGVHVLLDPGHGGRDTGAIQNGIREADYVYDVACRIKRYLERETGATVHLLVTDPKNKTKVRDTRKIPKGSKRVVATSPPYSLGRKDATTAGVNLRWLLANAIYRDLVKKKVPSDKIVFISLHADSLHSSLRGMMAYVPGERYRRKTYRHRGATYRRYAESKGAKKVSFTRKQRLRDEAVSKRLAKAIMDGFKKEKLPIHKNQPIRNHIRKGRRQRWVPAVIRGNQVPAKILLETVNIGNKKDAELLTDPEGRERMARAVAYGLGKFYD